MKTLFFLMIALLWVFVVLPALGWVYITVQEWRWRRNFEYRFPRIANPDAKIGDLICGHRVIRIDESSVWAK